MIRLAVNGDQAVWQQVSIRLRNAAVVAWLDLREPGAGHSENGLENCDAVVIAEPTDRSLDLANRVLASGQPVLMVADGSQPFSAFSPFLNDAEAGRFKFCLINPDRFLPSRQLIHQQLRAGKLGEPGLIRIHRWETGVATTPGADQNSPLPTALLLDLDLVNWLTGQVPERIYVTEAALPASGASAGRTIQVHLGYHDGSMALVGYSNALRGGPGYQSLSVIGSAGAAYADDHQNMQLLCQQNRTRAVRTDEGVRQWASLTQEFVDTLRDGGNPSQNVMEWRTLLSLKNAAETSLATRQAVEVEAR